MEKENVSFRNYLGITFLIGFGFLTMGLMDPLYDTYIPIFLKRYIQSNAAVGGIMTVDNVLQLLLIPIISIWSDRTRTKIGRRMPFIIVMLPISAVIFIFIPSVARISLLALISIIFVFNIFKTSVRGPVVALMPDTVPPSFRSEANGVINMMGGIGLIISTLALARLMDEEERLPFFVAGLCIIIAVTVLFIFVKERVPSGKKEEKTAVLKAVKQAFSTGGSSVPRILISLFFWFMAYEGVKPFLGLYLTESLGVSEGSAALAQGVAGISSVIMAVPAGYLAHRFGRRNYICMNLIMLAAILFLIPLGGLVVNMAGIPSSAALVLFLILMFLYGAVWMGVVVNSFPMLWQMASFGTIGVYTGLYYTFSQGAAILAPPITGAIIDFFDYKGIFIFGGLCMVAALFTMRKVRAGEVTRSA
ncbi:MAG: MFS transporter [Spirochaetaceae bacterium]|jgi:MFS family permease|nr:MFS transporter [Spirochaetaceae bacterium]